MTIEISHYGVCATDGIVNGQFVPRGSILVTKWTVPVGKGAEFLRKDKKLVHHILDHRRNLDRCRENLCGKIQTEIDSLIGSPS